MNWTFLFPGQGSQALGMGQWLCDEFKTAQETFQEASDAIGVDIKKLCFNSNDQELALTINTQPALLCVSTATQRILQEKTGLKAHWTAGHSIGEYASLVLADTLDFSVAMKAVRLRGEAMQSAVPEGQGGMVAALGLNEEQARFLCDWVQTQSGCGPLQPANFNAPGQIVLSGQAQALAYLREHFKPEILPGEARRVKLIPLNVSAPFHSSMMKPAEITMGRFFEPLPFRPAKMPVIQNLTAEPTQDPAVLKMNLIAQVSGSVLWSQSVEKIASLGSNHFIECGHGSVLKGLVKKIHPDSTVFTLQNSEDLRTLETALKAAGH